MCGAGVDVSFFNDFKWRAPLDYAGRTHRKLLLLDGEFGLVGGAGISDLGVGVEKDDGSSWLRFVGREGSQRGGVAGE